MASAPPSNSQSQTPASSSNPQQSSKSKEPDDPVTKLKAAIPLLKEVVTVYAWGKSLIMICECKL